MKKTPLIFKRRKQVEEDLLRYERQMLLYFNKMKKARKKLQYYDRKIEQMMVYKPDGTPKRVVEV